MSTIRKKFFKSTGRSNYSEPTKSHVKRELKFAPLDPKGFASQATYKQVKDALLVKIDKNIDTDLRDIRKCIQDEVVQPLAEPVQEVAVGANPAELALSENRCRILYDCALKQWSRRRYNLEANLAKVRSMIWDDFTSNDMKDKLEPLSNFATLSDDPVALLKAIKLQMHDTVGTQYCEWTRMTAADKFHAFRQKDLSLSDYIAHFKEIRDVFTTQNGTGFNDSYVAERVAGFDALPDARKKELQRLAYEQWVAIAFIMHCDPNRYGSLIEDLKDSFARERNEYPKTLEKAIDLLENRQWDSRPKNHSESSDQDRPRSKSRSTEAMKTKAATILNQQKSPEFKCHCCGSPDHTPSNCPLKDKIDQSMWFKETGKKPNAKAAHAQTNTTDNNNNDDDASVDSSSQQSNSRSGRASKKSNGWCNVMLHNQTSEIDNFDLRDVILLDTGSTIGATICNSKYIANVKPTTEVLHMTTNAGCSTLR